MPRDPSGIPITPPPRDPGPIPSGYVIRAPAEIIDAIRDRRNGDDQALGDLAALQEAFGDTEIVRIVMQCAYALGYRRAAIVRDPELRFGALAWVVIEELAPAENWLEAFKRAATAAAEGTVYTERTDQP
jgi:hypothetical protein